MDPFEGITVKDLIEALRATMPEALKRVESFFVARAAAGAAHPTPAAGPSAAACDNMEVESASAPASECSESEAEAETGTDSEYESDSTVTSVTIAATNADNDGFKPVVHKKRKAKDPSKSPPPTKKRLAPTARRSCIAPPPAVLDSPASPDPPAASVPTRATPLSPAAQQSTPPTPAADSQPRVKAPPPVFIQDKTCWDRVSRLLSEKRIHFTHARSTAQGIRVLVQDSTTHRRLTSFLRMENISFHTYALDDEKQLRVVLRGIPKEIPISSITEDLKLQNLPVREVHRMYHPRTKLPYDLVLVVLDLSPEGKGIFAINKVCQLSGIQVEVPKNRGAPGQCHRCQLYGHSARHCHAKPRCVKCTGDHGTSDCPRKTRDPEIPPSCVLCNTQGHPANYRGCSKAPKRSSKKAQPSRSASRPRQQPAQAAKEASKAPTNAPQPSQPPKAPSVAPQANRLGAWAKPLPMVKKPTAKSAPKAPAPPQPQPGSVSASELSTFLDGMMQFISGFKPSSSAIQAQTTPKQSQWLATVGINLTR
ncbi:unnamed protein product [Euphydryas editha]|uniref:Pre-C2HC domain-containing protein n=1 Tax=Euphydryas editha TaxID=104508 RepID=A0AAU9UKV0_EUPED|nr:unnamed protein product [Euphydryas editha]